MRPVQPPVISPARLNYGMPQENKPWPLWFFPIYIVILIVLWLVAKPIMDELVTQLIEPLSIAGYLDLFYHILVYVLFIGLFWIGFSNTFRREGQ
jgi:flagellar biosynthesis/type III secretory pathway M-ring protein FliF/YscJ